MAAEIKDLLPVGSVVFLQTAVKKVMIIGIKQRNQENHTTYDYVGVLYPEGYISNKVLFNFNHKDVMDIVYRGYENSEQEDFLKMVQEIMARQSDASLSE